MSPDWTQWGLSAVCGMAFLQSLGIPIPSVLLLVPLGLVVRQGNLELWQICVAFFTGQTLGDCSAYGLTLVASDRINRIFPRLYSRRDHPIVRKLLARGPALTLLLAYFLSWFRPIVNYLAPVLGIPFGAFLGWSFLRNVVANSLYVVMVSGGVSLFVGNPTWRPWLAGVVVLLGLGMLWWRLKGGGFRLLPTAAIEETTESDHSSRISS